MSFYTKFQENILKHNIAIIEKHDRQSSLFHPVHRILFILGFFMYAFQCNWLLHILFYDLYQLNELIDLIQVILFLKL